MAVPKKRQSRSRKGNRCSHNAIKPPSFSTCSNCQESIMPHRVCPKCGWYAGREIVVVED